MGELFQIIIALFIMFILPILLSAIIFPLPVSDSGTVRYRTFPWMTVTLIAINCIMFFLWQGTGYLRAIFASNEMEFYRAIYDFRQLTYTYAWRNYFVTDGVSIGAFVSFTSMFMHGDPEHLFGNMVFLWAFGRRVEDATGPWRFLVFYLIAGFVASLGSGVLNPRVVGGTGSLGASGAISGVMAAYLFLFPGSKVDCLWGIDIGLRFLIRIPMLLLGLSDDDDDDEESSRWRWTMRFPAWILLIFFAVSDIVSSVNLLRAEDPWSGGSTNNIAHMTGFLAGASIFLFVRKDLLMRYIAGRRL